MRNRVLIKFTRYSKVYSRNAVELLTSRKIQAWATGVTLLGVPLLFKSYFDTMLPPMDVLKEIQENQQEIKEMLEEINRKQNEFHEAISRPWYRKILDNISIEVSFGETQQEVSTDQRINDVERRLEAI